MREEPLFLSLKGNGKERTKRMPRLRSQKARKNKRVKRAMNKVRPAYLKMQRQHFLRTVQMQTCLTRLRMQMEPRTPQSSQLNSHEAEHQNPFCHWAGSGVKSIHQPPQRPKIVRQIKETRA